MGILPMTPLLSKHGLEGRAASLVPLSEWGEPSDIVVRSNGRCIPSTFHFLYPWKIETALRRAANLPVGSLFQSRKRITHPTLKWKNGFAVWPVQRGGEPYYSQTGLFLRDEELTTCCNFHTFNKNAQSADGRKGSASSTSANVFRVGIAGENSWRSDATPWIKTAIAVETSRGPRRAIAPSICCDVRRNCFN